MFILALMMKMIKNIGSSRNKNMEFINGNKSVTYSSAELSVETGRTTVKHRVSSELCA